MHRDRAPAPAAFAGRPMGVFSHLHSLSLELPAAAPSSHGSSPSESFYPIITRCPGIEGQPISKQYPESAKLEEAVEERGIQAWDEIRQTSKYVEDLTDEEAALIEKRMRPGAYSESGSLDASERLREVAVREPRSRSPVRGPEGPATSAEEIP